MNRSRGVSVLALVLAAGTALAETRPVDIRRPLDAEGVVTVRNVNGAVTVEGWDKKELEVTGTTSGDVEDVEVSGTTNRMRVEARFPEGRRRTSGSADLRIRMPAGGSVRVHVVNADITVGDLDGEVDLEAVNGDIEVTGKPSRVAVKTVNGDVRVDAPGARVEAETVGGRVRLENVGRDVHAASVGGDIEIAGGRIQRARFTTVSGSVEIDAGLDAGATLDANSHSGVVTLRLPASVSAEFDINTFSGDIHNAFGPQPRKKGYGPGRDLSFTTGGGDAQISINTFSGDVHLMK